MVNNWFTDSHFAVEVFFYSQFNQLSIKAAASVSTTPVSVIISGDLLMFNIQSTFKLASSVSALAGRPEPADSSPDIVVFQLLLISTS